MPVALLWGSIIDCPSIDMYSSYPPLATRRCFVSLLLLALVLYHPRAVAQQIRCSSAPRRFNIKYDDCRTATDLLTQRIISIGSESLSGHDLVYNLRANHELLTLQHGTCEIILYANPGPIPLFAFTHHVSRVLALCVLGQDREGMYTDKHFIVYVLSPDTRDTHSPRPSDVQEHRPGRLPDVRAAIHQVLQQSPDIPMYAREHPVSAAPLAPIAQAANRNAAILQSLSYPTESQEHTSPATGPNTPLALPQNLQASAIAPWTRGRKGSQVVPAGSSAPPRARRRKGSDPRRATM